MLFNNVANDPDSLLDQQAVDTEFYAAALKELVGLGVDIARIIHQQATAQSLDSPYTPIDESTVLAFERVSRAIRRGIMLAQRLREPPAPRTAAPPRHPAPERPSRRKPEQDRTDRLDRPDMPDIVDPAHLPALVNELREDLGLPPIAPPRPGARPNRPNPARPERHPRPGPPHRPGS